ncbi:hypothetical protein C8R45DRAFT_1024147 [Mycena sanguinolenta]|nr:hypothetical protein C8R45DRAFT_1024147 [Mycena sanguinolenta]
MTSDPTLPPELERQIFELAAKLHPNKIPKFLRVARRVLQWLEPFLYNVVTVGPGRTLSAIVAASKSKPASFLHNTVRHVLLVPMNVWRFAGSEHKLASAVLPLLTGMEDFTALGDVKPINLPDIFGTVRLRRLAMNLTEITDPVNLTLPYFSSITHLDIFDEILAEHESTWADLAAMPCLTHLCFHAVVPANVWKMVVRTCPDIQLLVNQWSSLRAPAARHIAKNPPVNDPRFVVLFVSGYADQWEEGARGGEDFWIRGACFVAQKRKGEIPGTPHSPNCTSLRSYLYHSVFIFDRPPELHLVTNTSIPLISLSSIFIPPLLLLRTPNLYSSPLLFPCCSIVTDS